MKIESKTAIPTEVPIMRKQLVTLLATPGSPRGDLLDREVFVSGLGQELLGDGKDLQFVCRIVRPAPLR